MVKIDVRPNTRAALAARRLSRREPYDQVIERLLEDTEELDPQTKRELERARREVLAGNFKTQEQVERELGLSPAHLRTRARPAAPRSTGHR